MTAGWLAISSASSEDIATPLIIPECFFNGITPIVMDFWSSGLDVLTNRPKPDTLYFSSQSGEKEGLARRPAWHKRQASCLAQAPGVRLAQEKGVAWFPGIITIHALVVRSPTSCLKISREQILRR